MDPETLQTAPEETAFQQAKAVPDSVHCSPLCG